MSRPSRPLAGASPSSLAGALRGEHHRMRPFLMDIREAADAVGLIPATELRVQLLAIHEFLTLELVPHAAAEERHFYPAVARLLGSAEATRPMSWEHMEVGILVEALGALVDQVHFRQPDAALCRDLRRVLYGLYALLTVHFAKEEALYLPVLEQRLTSGEAEELMVALGLSAAAPSDDAASPVRPPP